jgi:hypothetical protein
MSIEVEKRHPGDMKALNRLAQQKYREQRGEGRDQVDKVDWIREPLIAVVVWTAV